MVWKEGNETRFARWDALKRSPYNIVEKLCNATYEF